MKLIFLSDNTEAEIVTQFKLPIKAAYKFEKLTFIYTKARTNTGKQFELTIKQIQNLQSVKLLKIE